MQMQVCGHPQKASLLRGQWFSHLRSVCLFNLTGVCRRYKRWVKVPPRGSVFSLAAQDCLSGAGARARAGRAAAA